MAIRMTTRTERLARELNSRREAFRAFLVARVGSAADAEDILQNGLLKAVRSGSWPRDDTRLAAWFYQLLRNAIVDHHRARAARHRREDALGRLADRLGENVTPPRTWETQICGCLDGVIATLRPAHAELLRRVDLDGQPVRDAARALGLTPNNASVALHRARRELRVRLLAFCGACAAGACLNCDCAPADRQQV
jgi:RNA polymerase sigma-70 factor (ECF subfamily)